SIKFFKEFRHHLGVCANRLGGFGQERQVQLILTSVASLPEDLRISVQSAIRNSLTQRHTERAVEDLMEKRYPAVPARPSPEEPPVLVSLAHSLDEKLPGFSVASAFFFEGTTSARDAWITELVRTSFVTALVLVVFACSLALNVASSLLSLLFKVLKAFKGL